MKEGEESSSSPISSSPSKVDIKKGTERSHE